jgi:hypothetical protein
MVSCSEIFQLKFFPAPDNKYKENFAGKGLTSNSAKKEKTSGDVFSEFT